MHMMGSGQHGSGVRSMFNGGATKRRCAKEKIDRQRDRIAGNMDDGVKGTKPPGAAKRSPRLRSHAVTAQSNTAKRTRDRSCTSNFFNTANNCSNIKKKMSHIVHMCMAQTKRMSNEWWLLHLAPGVDCSAGIFRLYGVVVEGRNHVDCRRRAEFHIEHSAVRGLPKRDQCIILQVGMNKYKHVTYIFGKVWRPHRWSWKDAARLHRRPWTALRYLLGTRYIKIAELEFKLPRRSLSPRHENEYYFKRYTICGSHRPPQQHPSALWTHQIGDPGERYGRNFRGDPGEEKVGSSCDSEAHVGEDLVDLPVHCQHEWTADFDRGYLQWISTKQQYTSGLGLRGVATSVEIEPNRKLHTLQIGPNTGRTKLKKQPTRVYVAVWLVVRPTQAGSIIPRTETTHQRCAENAPTPHSSVRHRVTGASGGNPGVVELGIYHNTPPAVACMCLRETIFKGHPILLWTL